MDDIKLNADGTIKISDAIPLPTGAYTSFSTRQPDELSLVDEDVKKIFEECTGYFIGHPTMVQLIKELRILNKKLEKNVVL